MIVHSNKVTKKPGQKPAQVATYRPVMPAAAAVGGGVHDKVAEKAVIYSDNRENYTLDNGYVYWVYNIKRCLPVFCLSCIQPSLPLFCFINM